MRGVEFAWDAERPRTLIMGIVNVTPDSFADGGRYLDPAAAVRQARALAAEGADLLDVGAESTRPGSPGVPADEERARLLPVLERLLDDPPCPVSVDTSKPEVAEAALALGAHMVNDVTGLAGGPELARVCAAHGAGARGHAHAGDAAHHAGRPAVRRPPGGGAGRARDRGGDRGGGRRGARVASAWIPASGSARRSAHNLTLLKRLDALRPLGKPILVGPSRKSFIGALLDQLPPGGAARGDAGRLRHGRDGGRAHRARPRRRRRAAGGPGGRGHPRRRAGMSGS